MNPDGNIIEVTEDDMGEGVMDPVDENETQCEIQERRAELFRRHRNLFKNGRSHEAHIKHRNCVKRGQR